MGVIGVGSWSWFDKAYVGVLGGNGFADILTYYSVFGITMIMICTYDCMSDGLG